MDRLISIRQSVYVCVWIIVVECHPRSLLFVIREEGKKNIYTIYVVLRENIVQYSKVMTRIYIYIFLCFLTKIDILDQLTSLRVYVAICVHTY